MRFSRRTRNTCLIVAGCAGVLVCFRRPDPPAPVEKLDMAAIREMARLGEGLLVWERKVAKEWQIWMKPLDGSAEDRRLVPAEQGRDHFCPKLSLDGRRLAYMSYARGQTPYEPAIGVLWMLDMETRERCVLAEKARSYFEDRAVIWHSDHTLCHVDESGNAVELDVLTGSRKPLTSAPHKKHGWLVNAQKTYATSGEPEFPPYDATAGAVIAKSKHGGCQPYFSADGRWGYWMGGPGGPVNRMFLPTRMVGQILGHEDPRLPRERDYLYFPMLSNCGRMLIFGSSPNGHDHFESDYDLFIQRVDKETLDPIGRAVRFTVFEGNDRFPDLFCRDLPLQSRYVEGPTELSFKPRPGESFAWTINGEAAGTSEVLKRVFTEVGDHWVEAVPAGGGDTLRGLVHVRAPEPPKIELVRREDGGALSVTFDEAVNLSGAQAAAGNGAVLPWGIQSAENHTVLLPMPVTVPPGTKITLRGVHDLAQHPVEMPATTLTVPGRGWLESQEGLVVAWENRHTPPLGLPEAGPVLKGKAHWSPRGGVDVRGGSAEFAGLGGAMVRECARSGAFTVEAIITPMVPPNDLEMRPVLSLENSSGDVCLALLQRRSALSVWLATEDNPRGTTEEQPLMPIRTGQPYHVVLGYQNGQFMLVVNGEQSWVHAEVRGALRFTGKDGTFRIGACSKLDHPWQGQVDQLSVHSRLLSAGEAMAHADHAAPKVATQRTVKTSKVMAKLVETSRTPALAQISPYRDALVQQLYEVLPKEETDAEQSFPVGSRLTVSHWVWVNGESVRRPPVQPGKVYKLFVQTREAHPEIAPLVQHSDLDPTVDAVEVLDVTNW